MEIDTIKSISEIASSMAAAFAVIAAGGWFLYTTQFKQRLQFDVEVRVLSLMFLFTR
jgi:hypothetical protein